MVTGERPRISLVKVGFAGKGRKIADTSFLETGSTEDQSRTAMRHPGQSPWDWNEQGGPAQRGVGAEASRPEARRILGLMDGSRDDLAAARSGMVASQLRRRGIADERVLRAMNTIPREQFVSDAQRGTAYADEALPIPAGQTISQPYMVARMTELVAPKPGDRVLEIGTGSGYQTAILALLGAAVVSIERQPELALLARERLARLGLGGAVDIRVGDGSVGDPGGAPYDGIVVTAAAPSIPTPLREQLSAAGGRLVIPVGDRFRQELMLVVRDGDQWSERDEGPCIFVPLVGEAGFPG